MSADNSDLDPMLITCSQCGNVWDGNAQCTCLPDDLLAEDVVVAAPQLEEFTEYLLHPQAVCVFIGPRQCGKTPKSL